MNFQNRYEKSEKFTWISKNQRIHKSQRKIDQLILYCPKFDGCGSKFGTTKSRTTNISKFQNYEY